MDKFILEKQFDLTEDEQMFVDFLQGSDCPYFIQPSGYGKGEYVWAHVLMRRDKDNRPVEGEINSHLYEHARNIFLRFCSENGIKPDVVLRACVNATGCSSKPHGFIHVDHSQFHHYNFILYMNEVGGNTYMFNEKNSVMYEIQPKKNKVAIFEGQPHAQAFCAPGDYRYVLVFTFTTKEKL